MIRRFDYEIGNHGLVSLLKACARKKDIFEGIRLHADIVQKGLLGRCPYISSSLITMYAKCGMVEKAYQVLRDMQIHDLVSWNALISGYSQHGQIHDALNCFQQMKREGFFPNAVTFMCILKACGSIGYIDVGEEMYKEIVCSGLLEDEAALATALVDMYVKCGVLRKAKEVLEQLPIRNTVTWNALIAGYTKLGQGYEAFNCFERMQTEGLAPDTVTFICILKVCGQTMELVKGIEIHIEILKKGVLGEDIILGNTLVDMYAKCGVLEQAKQVFKGLPAQNVVSWNTLIAGYAQHGQYLDALNCFEKMKNEGISPDAVTFICILKVCGCIGDIDQGRIIHRKVITKRLLEKDIILGNALVDMYAKCGGLAEALEIFDNIPIRNGGCWNALIAGYVQQEQGHEALNFYEQMQCEGLSPDATTLIFILKACGSIGDVKIGNQIHEKISCRGLLGKNIVLGAAMVDMYAKCGTLSKAQQVLEELPDRNIIAWSSLISGFMQHGKNREALNCFNCMRHEGLSPDAITFHCILKACGSIGAIGMGKKIHDEILNKCMLEKDTDLNIALIDMYAKCGQLQKAEELVRENSLNEVAAWNALIEGYAHWEQYSEALNCMEQMRDIGLPPNTATFICILKTCSSLSAIEEAVKIHEEIMCQGLLEKDILIGTALVDMYAKCGVIGKALQVFQELRVNDLVTWNALISGYAHKGLWEEVWKCFSRMLSESQMSDVMTFVSTLKACGNMGAIRKGKQIHAISTFFGNDIVLPNALVDMYAKCGVLAEAELLLEQLPVQSIVSWNSLIAGYVQNGQGFEALNCFLRLQSEGLCPDAITFTSVLMACKSVGAFVMGEQIHEHILNSGMLKKDIMLGDALIDMYVKCDMIEKAHQVLKELPIRDTISWNSLITGYAQQGHCQEAFTCLEQMQNEGLSPDVITFVCILKACGSSGAIDKGEGIHKEISRRQLLEKDILLGNALIDMYAKCGTLPKAQLVIDELPVRDVVSWNTLIAGYAEQGQGYEALNCFTQMRNEKVSPDGITFLCVLSACSHAGLLDEAETLFGQMASRYGVCPNIEHHCCMVLVFGCAGRFDESISVIMAMPSIDHPAIWLALLGVCKKWGNVRLASLAFDQTLQLDDSSAAVYILMADIFTANGMLADAEGTEAMRRKYAAKWKEGSNVEKDASGMSIQFLNGMLQCEIG